MSRRLEIEREPVAAATQMLHGTDFADAVRLLADAREQALAGTLDPKIFARKARKALRQVQNALDEQRGLEEYRVRVREGEAECKIRDGELECDTTARVSVSDDGGAYVACWVWIYDPEPAEAADAEPQDPPAGRRKERTA